MEPHAAADDRVRFRYAGDRVAGPAGQRAAIQAAKLGTRATIIEQRAVIGGVCINTGTIPSKTLREAVITCRGIANAISTERRIP